RALLERRARLTYGRGDRRRAASLRPQALPHAARIASYRSSAAASAASARSWSSIAESPAPFGREGAPTRCSVGIGPHPPALSRQETVVPFIGPPEANGAAHLRDPRSRGRQPPRRARRRRA